LDGGTNNVGNPETFVVADLDITLLDPTKDSFTFVAWHDNVGLTSTITTIDTLADIEIWAEWTE